MIRIKIHTMLNRAKNYIVAKESDATIVDGSLVIIGTNDMSKEQGIFRYPLINIEHFNLVKIED